MAFEVVSYSIGGNEILCVGEIVVTGDSTEAFKKFGEETSKLKGKINWIKADSFKYSIPYAERVYFGSLLEKYYGEEDYSLMAKVVSDCSR